MEVEIHDTSIAILDETMTTLQQTHDTDINNLDETMATLQLSMSDLEDIVDSVEDDVTALNVENDEIQQRLIVLEEILIGIFTVRKRSCEKALFLHMRVIWAIWV